MTDSIREAELNKSETGVSPQGEGWFVLNARDVSWIQSEERGHDTDFEGGQDWTQLGFRIQVLQPGQRNGRYHRERGQEDFLVVAGECVLVIEDEERRLKTWDFVHCPPWTHHVFVGAGEGPCVIVMTGSRAGGFEVTYPVNEVAAKHGASVLEETSKPAEAYAKFGPEQRSAYREGWLPSTSQSPARVSSRSRSLTRFRGIPRPGRSENDTKCVRDRRVRSDIVDIRNTAGSVLQRQPG